MNCNLKTTDGSEWGRLCRTHPLRRDGALHRLYNDSALHRLYDGSKRQQR